MLDTANVAHYEMMGSSLLAQTPAMARRWQELDDRSWEMMRLQLEQRLYSLRNWRLSWWAHWAALADAILPRRYHWLIVPNTMTRGLAINQAIVDPTGAQAVRVCTAGMRSGLMSSSRPWFKLKPGLRNFPLDRAAQLWFEEVQERIYAVMATSNFYHCGSQMFEDLIVFGTAPMLIYEDRQSVIRCYNPCAGEYYLGCGADFRINSFYRTFVLTVIQCVEMFGLDNVGPEVKSLWENKGASLETEVIVAHAIEPNFPAEQPGERSNLGVVPGGFPYREYYWLWGRNTPRPCSVKGFRRKPFIAPRWATTSNDAYGRSPGMDALPDILQLHQMTRRQAEAIDKIVRPPLLGSLALKNQPSSILPGKVTYVDDVNKGMKSIYDIRMDLSHMTALIEKIEVRVQKWFYNDLFQMMENLEGVQPRNEMEIAERRGEKLQVLGPVVEGVENEEADAIRQIYAIMDRRGLIPPKPRSLLGVPLSIEILSMIALAQRAAETAVMERVVTVASNMDKVFPERKPTDNINPDAFIREYADRTAVPQKILFGEQEVASARDARMKAQQQMMAKQEAASAATHVLPAVAGAAKDAADIDTGGGLNAIQMLLGQGGAAPGATGLQQ